MAVGYLSSATGLERLALRNQCGFADKRYSSCHQVLQIIGIPRGALGTRQRPADRRANGVSVSLPTVCTSPRSGRAQTPRARRLRY